MNLNIELLTAEEIGVPHTRGDEPCEVGTGQSGRGVFPTPVGMNRIIDSMVN